ncbi:DNA-binding transcriptional regulator, XRE-family HTH domain [Pedobacter westerhofensis]|uniref:DNA-binding transcriptional regulator, XRE-family HTH domain n=1 Tax=Pedobacter westerhofensis TaxID=425512 RepID=A0A521EYA7_9SPHI|nr:helix-turn-helix transcriptional regulator [Pedobacter westerhofensis]SMO88899.1 DNA-binding transcriptional regulator, XRE-family HTH domain [Pedobacter westerhofensis]
MSKTTYNRIKSVLAEKKKTNKELADALKIAPETVSSWCTNSVQPSIKRLFDIALYLEVEATDLLVSVKISKG